MNDAVFPTRVMWLAAWLPLGVAGLLHAQNNSAGDLDALPIAPPGFRVAFAAREPLVRNPCSLAFDDRGRLCVGMGPQYRSPRPDTPGDEVVILLDTDRDGVFDARKTFARGFNAIQGLAWRGSDLWVANAPDLTLVRDTDGDDVADQYIRIYTDLGNLEHGLHGLNWAPDGRLYMSKGNSKGLTRPGRLAPKPFRQLWGVRAPEGAPDFPPPQTYRADQYRHAYHDPADDWGREGGVLVCDDLGRNLEIVSRGFRNPWDIAFDADFNWQGTDNDQNEGDRVFTPFFGSHYGWGHSWSAHWTGRDHLPTAPISGPVFHGSGTGIVYCESPQFPPEYRGVWLFNDWLQRTTFLYRVKWDGALMQPEGGKWQPFLRGGKALFKPTDLEVGPDGSLYVLGWGRQYGAQWNNKKEQINEGRIFRVTWIGKHKSLPPVEPLQTQNRTNWSVDRLIRAFRGPLPIWRINAQEELLRRGEGVAESLRAALASKKLTAAEQTWTAWTLGRLAIEDKQADSFFRARALARDVPVAARVQAIRILAHRARFVGKPERLPLKVAALLQDAEPRVRLAAVLAIRRARQREALAQLWKGAATEDDRVVFYAAWQALRKLASADNLQRGLADPRAGVRRAALLALAEDRRLVRKQVSPLLTDPDKGVRSVAALWLAKAGGNPLLVVEPPGGEFAERIRINITPGMKPARLRYTLDGTTPTAASRAWSGTLTLRKTTRLKVALFVGKQQIGPAGEYLYRRIGGVERASRSGVLTATAQSRRPYRIVDGGLREGRPVYTDRAYVLKRVPPGLQGALMVQTPNDDAGSRGDRFLQIDAVIPVTLFFGYDKRIGQPPAWLRKQLKSGWQIAAGKTIQTNDTEFRLYQKQFPAGRISLGGNTDDGKDGGKSNYLVVLLPAGLPPRAKPTRIADVLPRLTTASARRGKALFFAEGGAGCAKCHRSDTGTAAGFGPDLQHLVKEADPRRVVESILEPSAQIKEGFTLQIVIRADGRKQSGILHSETKTALTLLQPDGKRIVVPRDQIEERIGQRISPMPSFEKLLSPQQVADITHWLVTRRRPRP